MVQHWTPMSELTPSLRPGEWLMADRSRRIGYICYTPQTRSYACQTAENAPDDRIPLGSAKTLPEAARRLWEWGKRTPRDWTPTHELVELHPRTWAMRPRPGHHYPQGYIQQTAQEGDEKAFTATSGGTDTYPCQPIGIYPTLDIAARAIWAYPIKA